MQAEPETVDDFGDADAILAALADDYPAFAATDVAAMRDALARGRGGDGLAIEALYAIAHNVKGQGGSFGYELMTALGDALCALLRHRRALSADELDRAAALVDACETVLADRLTGAGGARGATLMASLGVEVPA